MFNNLFLKLRNDLEHLWMSPDRFHHHLLTLVGDKVQKQTITISPVVGLSLTLRCLIAENS